MLTRRVPASLLTAALLIAAAATPAAAVPAPPPLHQGWIVTQANAARCLTGGPAGTVLHTATCDRANKAQDFYQTSEGHFTQGENCLQPNTIGSKVLVTACSYQPAQSWWFATTLQAGDQRGRCVTELSVDTAGLGRVRLRDCTAAAGQSWRSVNPW